MKKLPVTKVEVEEVFGPKFTLSFANKKLSPEDLEALTDLYWCCYGIDDVINSIFQVWFATSYIAERNGKTINWCKGAVRTAKERRRRVLAHKLKLGEITMSEYSAATEYGSLGAPERRDSKSHIIDQDSKSGIGICGYGVLTAVLQGVVDVSGTYAELLSLCCAKISHLEALHSCSRDKLRAFELNMEDRQGGISDYKEMILFYKSELRERDREEEERPRILLRRLGCCHSKR